MKGNKAQSGLATRSTTPSSDYVAALEEQNRLLRIQLGLEASSPAALTQDSKKASSKKKKSKAKKKQPKGLVEAKQHCYEARVARRASDKRGGYGMTKAEKSALYADLVAKYGKRPSTRQWNDACDKVRKG